MVAACGVVGRVSGLLSTVPTSLLTTGLAGGGGHCDYVLHVLVSVPPDDPSMKDGPRSRTRWNAAGASAARDAGLSRRFWLTSSFGRRFGYGHGPLVREFTARRLLDHLDGRVHHRLRQSGGSPNRCIGFHNSEGRHNRAHGHQPVPPSGPSSVTTLPAPSSIRTLILTRGHIGKRHFPRCRRAVTSPTCPVAR